jgi:DNA-binding NarL/FixJ family response regulator
MRGLYKICIIETHLLFREGLKALLKSSTEPTYEIVSDTGDGMEAIRSVEKWKPEAAILDLDLPRISGHGTIREIKKISPDTNIVALSTVDDEEFVFKTLQTGAKAYCLKNIYFEELLQALEDVLTGKYYLSSNVFDKFLDFVLHKGRPHLVQNLDESLSPRERDILKFIAEGYKSKEIAEYLCISKRTVEKHRSNIMKKLNIHRSSSLVAFAIKRGFLH